ncbi:MAG TPA: glycosyltransferase family 4 protein [Candidatus Paceibacterota bacterium]|nr:glycosyltransferase family 4 protein [Candidatus Paceibacterota bacterium]
MKKRIQIIVPDKIKNPVGGLGVQLKHMMENLEKDFDFDIIGQPEDNGWPNYTSVYNPMPAIQHGSITTIAGQIAYFAAGIEKPKPDIVHAYDWSTYLAGAYTADFFKVPLVVTMNLSINLLEKSGITYSHNSQTVDGAWLHKTHCEIELYGLRKAKKIIHVSEGYRNRFKGAENFEQKSEVVPNGIELSEWQSLAPFKLPGTGRIKLIYIGRLALMKGVMALCEARIPDGIDLIFIGADNGGEAQVFQRMLEKVKNESNVHYIGPLYGQDKINAMCAADAVIMPSIHEPFGIVALEALASKSILLSSFVDGMSDFLSEEIAINCGTTKGSIERALLNLLSLPAEDKRIRIEKGLEICRRYSWKSAAEKMKNIYQDLSKY